MGIGFAIPINVVRRLLEPSTAGKSSPSRGAAPEKASPAGQPGIKRTSSIGFFVRGVLGKAMESARPRVLP